MRSILLSVVASLGLLAGQVPGAAGAAPEPTDAVPPRVVDVLEIAYYPLTPDGKYIDINVTGDVGGLYTSVKAHVTSVSANLADALSQGSAYRGYANPAAPRDLGFHVVASLEFLTPVPSIPSSFNPDYPKRADYATIMASFDICDYVVRRGVDEVWIWAYQGPHQLDISESKMSGPYGDISNSYRLDDMPHCGRSYVVYTYNYGRDTDMAVEDHGHQIEAELDHLDRDLFRDLFQGPNYPATLGVAGRCGSVHNPPNARFEYDRSNPNKNPSDCLAWKPDGMGALSQISCANWGCAENGDADNPTRNYMVWWMQNLPGRGNTISYQGNRLRNWWDVYFDFDGVMSKNPSLTLTPFTDIAGSPFKSDIEWVYTSGITSGCTATTYCPSGYVTREQMASFLARALKLSGTAPDAFTDDEASPHEPNINLVAKAGIATGCAATKYCPTALVSREQMASFLARALKLAGSAPDAFTDDKQSIHEPNINLVAREGVATGCGNTKYCPTANVTRGQMAAFLHRAFGP